MRIRKGKDVAIRWRIFTNGNSEPLAGRELLLELKSPFGRVYELPFSVSYGNVIEAVFRGVDQQNVGFYTLTLWENKGYDGQTAVDAVRAFELVRTTDEEDKVGCDNDLTIETIDLGISDITLTGLTVRDLFGGGELFDLTGEEFFAIKVGDELRTISSATIMELLGTGGTGGTVGTTDYAKLRNKPQIGDVVLEGIMSADDLGLATKEAVTALQGSVTKNASDIATKQDELTLTVLDNGNIRIGNLEGQTKDFMPATPSGDPMHYAYEAWSAKYNSGEDYIYDTPWKDMVDSVEDKERWGQDIITSYTDYRTLTKDGKQYKIVKTQMNDGLDYKVVQEVNGKLVWDETKGVHISKHWLLNGVGDMTNDELQKIYPLAGITAGANVILGGDAYNLSNMRTLFPFAPSTSLVFSANSLYNLKNIISLPKTGSSYTLSSKFVLSNSNFFYIQSYVVTNTDDAAYGTTNLTVISIKLGGKSIKIDSTRLSKKSLLYMINNSGIAAATIKLNSTLYARFKDDEDVDAALASHTNVTLLEG